MAKKTSNSKNNLKQTSNLDLNKLPEKYHEKIKELESFFQGNKVVVAYSGGIDSTLVCFFAKQFAKDVQAVIIDSPQTPNQELHQAEEYSASMKIQLNKIQVDTLANPDIVQNTPLRCYFCKKDILTTLENFRKKIGFDLVVDGTNLSDLSLSRAGLKALQESSAKSPLALMKISKEEILDITCILGLPSTNIPSQACLASRIPFNVPLNAKLLHMIDDAEQYLRTLVKDQFIQLRVRVHPLDSSNKYLARIEADEKMWQIIQNQQVRKTLIEKLQEIGFTFITLDLEGFSSGSMHKIL
jgi:pyridinium-3,5-biscarboxylic acid mononucleotide sulfurtransferase